MNKSDEKLIYVSFAMEINHLKGRGHRVMCEENFYCSLKLTVYIGTMYL